MGRARCAGLGSLLFARVDLRGPIACKPTAARERLPAEVKPPFAAVRALPTSSRCEACFRRDRRTARCRCREATSPCAPRLRRSGRNSDRRRSGSSRRDPTGFQGRRRNFEGPNDQVTHFVRERIHPHSFATSCCLWQTLIEREVMYLQRPPAIKVKSTN